VGSGVGNLKAYEGRGDGTEEGDTDFLFPLMSVGSNVGSAVGSVVGCNTVGDSDGTGVGWNVGSEVGSGVGSFNL